MAWYNVQSYYFVSWVQTQGLSIFVLSILSGLLCWCVIRLRHHLSHEPSKWKRSAVVLSCLLGLWLLVLSWSAFVLLRFAISRV